MTLTFDLETNVRVALKVRNLPSNFGNARLLGSLIIHYERNKQMDKSNVYCPLPYGRGITKARTDLYVDRYNGSVCTYVLLLLVVL